MIFKGKSIECHLALVSCSRRENFDFLLISFRVCLVLTRMALGGYHHVVMPSTDCKMSDEISPLSNSGGLNSFHAFAEE